MSDTSSNSNGQTIRVRSRFPKAQPNLAISSGIARIRRLSGHYSTTTTSTIITPNQDQVDSTPNEFNDDTPLPSSSSLLKSPLKSSHIEGSNFRQFLNNNNNSPLIHHHHHQYLQPQTPTMFHSSPHGSVYNPQFSKEHIMNIIKHKALQKLKQIESQSLKERRKKYKKDSIHLLSIIASETSSSSLTALTGNESNDSIQSNKSNESKQFSAISGGSVDRSKLRMRDLLYYSSKSVNMSNKITIETPIPSPLPPPKETIKQLNAAPQLKISEDGSIILNEESLVIHRQHHEPVYSSTVVESEQNDNLTYNSYRKFHHTKKMVRT